MYNYTILSQFRSCRTKSWRRHLIFVLLVSLQGEIVPSDHKRMCLSVHGGVTKSCDADWHASGTRVRAVRKVQGVEYLKIHKIFLPRPYGTRVRAVRKVQGVEYLKIHKIFLPRPYLQWAPKPPATRLEWPGVWAPTGGVWGEKFFWIFK